MVSENTLKFLQKYYYSKLPFGRFRYMGKLKNNFNHFWEVLVLMTEKEFKIRYKYTLLGFLWLIINPLLQMVVIGTVFRFFVGQKQENYYYFLLVNLLAWNYFSLSLSKTTSSIVFGRYLIKKMSFFRSVIPISIILANLINIVIATMLIVAYAILNKMFFPALFPVTLSGLFLLVVFTTGLSLLFSSLNVKYRDVNFFVQAILVVWFYATPVVYNLTLIPNDYHYLWSFNPLTLPLYLFQSSFIRTESLPKIVIEGNLVIIIGILILGIIVFKRQSRYFDDWL